MSQISSLKIVNKFTNRKLSYSAAIIACSFISFIAHPLTLQAQEDRTGYWEQILPFSQWVQTTEGKTLNFFSGFSEPTVQIIENGVSNRKNLKLTIYSTRTQIGIDQKPQAIPIQKMITADLIRKMDTNAKSKQIGPSQTVIETVKKGSPQNFLWCNAQQDKPDFFVTQLETNLNHLSRPGAAWCSLSNTNCFETCLALPSGSALEAAIAAYNQMKKPGKDFGVATQVELRSFQNESEFQNGNLLKNLTKISTPIVGIIEVNIFYFNQILLFGKMLQVFQVDPKDNQKTVLTSLNAFGIRDDSWNHKIGGPKIQSVLKSKSKLNVKSGILSGLPQFSFSSAEAFAQIAIGK